MSETGTFCPVGEAGEIVVRGPLVFDGYLDDPQLTAQCFVGDWYRTGDIGRMDEDGYFYLVGRKKDIINRGWEKILPAEIDSSIEALAGVRAAAAFGIPHPTLGEEIVAAVVRAGDIAIEEVDILDQVRQQLGPKRAPRRIYFIDELPQTDNGKVRRAELPRLLGLAQPGVRPATKESPASAFSPLEAALAGLWSNVLQVSTVRSNDDFFLLGGDSLRGARLLASVKTILGVELPLPSLFGEAATVSGMARAIEAARSVPPGPRRLA